MAATSAIGQQVDQQKLKGLTWRLIGPFRAGRTLTATGIPDNPNVYYFGSVGGGVWKTTNAGITWQPIFDHQGISSIGSIAVAPSDPNIIYAGTGEGCIRGDISYGDGVYKSLDAGLTWKNVGLKDSRHIGAVIIDPHDPNIVFVAALGHAYGPNSERGIFRTTDGGATWEKVLYKDDKTGAIDIVFDPNNSHILFASLWQVGRTPWSLSSGGPGSGLYRSTDSGSTWQRIEGHGLPDGILGRIGISVSAADSNRIYALIEAEKGGLYRSDDGGDSWNLLNDDHRFRQRAWYFTHVFADPKSVDTVYVLNTSMFRSKDGGKQFARVSVPGGDHHDLWIDPANSDRMIEANDNGATVSNDGGKSWSSVENQPTGQFYHVATDIRFPYYVYGSQQDQDSIAIASDTSESRIDRPEWFSVGDGESGYVVPDPTTPDIVYSGGYFGGVFRYDHRTNQQQRVSPWPDDPDGVGAEDWKYRFTWTQPIVFSPYNVGDLFYSGNVLFHSKDAGQSWETVSPDLTRNDKRKQLSSGGPITKDNSGVEIYDTIFSVAASPAQRDVIWAGTDDGLIHITRDGGTHWTSATPPELPPWAMVSSIDASWHDAATAYVAVDAHKLDDFRPYIFHTHKFGKVWKATASGIPEGAYVHVVREDPDHGGLLFAGTELGIYVSFDDGEHWQPLQLNLPSTPVHDLTIKNSDLIAATHGRAFWILDDITPLRQLDSIHASTEAFLFQPRAAIRFRAAERSSSEHLKTAGEPAPRGATLYYWLKEKPAEKEEISLEIVDSTGKTIRKFTNHTKTDEKDRALAEEQDEGIPEDTLPAEAGLNRFAWNLRYEKPHDIHGTIYDDGDPRGAFALAGNYEVKLRPLVRPTLSRSSFGPIRESRRPPRNSPSNSIW